MNIVKNLAKNLDLDGFHRIPESERVNFGTKLFEQHPIITSTKKYTESRRVTRNFSRQRSFLEIRAL